MKWWLLTFFWTGLAWAADVSPTGHDFFERRVRPILVEHCYKCHSADAEKVKAGLYLDSREGLLKGGDSGPALVPGDPDKSRLILAVRHTDADLKMPKEKLSSEQIGVLEEWVKMGAPDPRTGSTPAYAKKELWSLKPIRKSEPPQPKAAAKDPIDRFIIAEVEKAGLDQAELADKSSLIRRATFDLHGLPPSPDEVDRFLADSSPDAFEKVIDRLLDSPHFGERWGRHWLDVARYGESNGRNQNLPLNNAWRYRDYVVQAFNADKPYPEFVREQLAGDLIPSRDNEDLHENWTATGFLVIGPKNFGEPNREKLLMDIADEQIDVTTRAFLGLTVSCARCHDHKFDPVPTKDYYAMAGIFRSTQTLAQGGGGPAGALVSERPLGTPEQVAAAEKYDRELAEAQAQRDAARRLRQTLPGGIDSKELDGIVLDNTEAQTIGEWKLSTYSTNFVDKNYLHDGADRRMKGKKSVRFVPEVPEDGFYEIRLAYTPRYDRATNVPVRVTGTAQKTIYLNQQIVPRYDKAFESLGVFELRQGTNNTVEILTEGTKGFVAVDAVQLLPKDVQLLAKYTKVRPPPAAGEGTMMPNVSAALLEEYEYKFMDVRSRPRPEVPATLAVRDGEVQNVKVHIRGDPERLGAEVPRGFLSVLEASGDTKLEGSGRLDLANWIANDRNPLTARVAVNRIWQHLFGHGLVATPDNFGQMGQPPSHPELLDYLAAEFIENGWSTKKLIKRLMLTRTYQLSGQSNAKGELVDPGNQLFWRANRKRLDAESLRDAILAVNGSLDRTVGGQINSPERNMAPGANNAAGDLPDINRRSLYLPVIRGALNDLFQVFDFPDPHALAGKRYVTTAPTQALFLMNSPFISRQAELWAKATLLNGGATDEVRVENVFKRAFARPPSARERERALAFLNQYEAALAANESEAAARKEKTWKGFCHAIYESTEFRFLN